MQFYGPYNQKMAITSFILTAECERLVPSYSVQGHSVSNHPKKRENETPPLPILLKFGVWDYQEWRRRYFNF